MNKVLIGVSLLAALATTTPAHAYYLRDCLRGAPCPGFYGRPTMARRPTTVRRPTMVRPGDTMVHQATTKTNSASVIRRSSVALLEQSLPKPLPGNDENNRRDHGALGASA
jgi:hypothetical protein